MPLFNSIEPASRYINNMNNQRKRELRGYRLFVGFSLLIIIIGVIMMVNDQHAFGKFGNRLTGHKNDSLSGFQTIFLGIIMLAGIGIVYVVDKPRKKKDA